MMLRVSLPQRYDSGIVKEILKNFVFKWDEAVALRKFPKCTKVGFAQVVAASSRVCTSVL